MKEMTRFRVCERIGSLLGIANIDREATPFPYKVEATRFTTMFFVTRKELLVAFSKMTVMDEHAARAAIKMEHEKHVRDDSCLSPATSSLGCIPPAQRKHRGSAHAWGLRSVLPRSRRLRTNRLTGWLADRPTDRPTDRLTDRLTGWLAD